MRSSCLLVLLAAVPATSCLILDRSAEVPDGALGGRGVRVIDGAFSDASFTKVQVVGGTRRLTAGSDGSFVVANLRDGRVDVRLVDDTDGDGWANRAATVAALLPPATGSQPRFISLGDVSLHGSFRVRGSAVRPAVADPTVTEPVGDDLVARVFALRGACASGGIDVSGAVCSGVDVTGRVELGADGEAAADGAGAWQLTALPEGTVDLVALLYERGADGGLGALVDIEGPVSFSGAADDSEEGTSLAGPTFVFDGAPVPSATVQLAFSEAVEAGAFAVFAAPGTVIGACDTPEARPAGAIVVDLSPGSTSLNQQIPAGPYQVVVCSGALRGALSTTPVALPSALPLLWPIVLLEGDPCPEGVDDRDCDGDGRRSLPVSALADFAAACAGACFPAGRDGLGAALAELVCVVDGVTYDCDDDADGQPDITEPPACVGLGKGADLDADGLCFPLDPFPHCAANSAALCPAGVEDIAPRVLGGGGIDSGVGNVSPVEIDFAAVGPTVTTQGSTAVFGVLVGRQAQDDFRIVTVDAGGGIDVDVAPWAVTENGNDAPIATRLDMAVGSSSFAFIAGGTLDACVGEQPCAAADRRTRFFADRLSVVAGDVLPLALTRAGLLTVPRARATVAGDAVAGGRGCAQAVTPEADGSVLCPTDALQVLDSIEDGTGVLPAVLSVARADATAVEHYDRATDTLYMIVIGGDVSGSAAPVEASAVVDVFERGDGELTRVDDGAFAANLNEARARHTLTAVELISGQQTLVVAGGIGPGAQSFEVLRVGESPTWVRGALRVPRAEHAAALLPDGHVALFGGINPATGDVLSSVEIIDPTAPAAGTTLGTPLAAARRRSVVVSNELGAFVVLGGLDAAGDAVTTAERFDVFIDVSEGSHVVGPAGLGGCTASAVQDDGARVAMLCTTVPGQQGDATQLVVVDVATNIMRCPLCGIGSASPTTLAISADGGRVTFVTAAAVDPFTVDDNGADDLFTFGRFGAIGFIGAISTRFEQQTSRAIGVDTGTVPGLAARASFFGDAFVASDGTLFVADKAISFEVALAPLGGRLAIAQRPDDNLRVAVRGTQRTSTHTVVFDVPRFGASPFFPSTRFLSGSELAAEPALSPSGRFLAHFAEAQGRVDLVLIDLDNNDAATVLSADLAAPCVLASCPAVALDDEGRVLWTDAAGRLLLTSRRAGVSHTVLDAGPAAQPSLAANGEWGAFQRDGRITRVDVALAAGAPQVPEPPPAVELPGCALLTAQHAAPPPQIAAGAGLINAFNFAMTDQAGNLYVSSTSDAPSVPTVVVGGAHSVVRSDGTDVVVYGDTANPPVVVRQALVEPALQTLSLVRHTPWLAQPGAATSDALGVVAVTGGATFSSVQGFDTVVRIGGQGDAALPPSTFPGEVVDLTFANGIGLLLVGTARRIDGVDASTLTLSGSFSGVSLLADLVDIASDQSFGRHFAVLADGNVVQMQLGAESTITTAGPLQQRVAAAATQVSGTTMLVVAGVDASERDVIDVYSLTNTRGLAWADRVVGQRGDTLSAAGASVLAFGDNLATILSISDCSIAE